MSAVWTVAEAGPRFRDLGRRLNPALREEYFQQLQEGVTHIKRKYFTHSGGPPRPGIIVSRTGRLESTVRATRPTLKSGTGLITGEIKMGGYGIPYARILERGGRTRPHMIFPRRPGGALHFFWNRIGKWVTLKHVHHPGSVFEPRLVLHRGMLDIRRDLILATGRGILRAMREVGLR